MNPSNPLIVQSDRTILLEVDHTQHAEARDAVAQFAELENHQSISTPIAFRHFRSGMRPLAV